MINLGSRAGYEYLKSQAMLRNMKDMCGIQESDMVLPKCQFPHNHSICSMQCQLKPK